MPKLPTQSPIEYLVSRKYPGSQFGREDSITNDNKKPTELIELHRKADAYTEELESKTPEELDNIYKEEKAQEILELQAKQEDEDKKRSFNQPYALANYDHWSRMASLRADQFVALCLGRDPNYVAWEKISIHQYESPFVQKYARLRQITNNAVASRTIGEFDTALNFVRWAERLDVPVPKEFADLVKKRSAASIDWQQEYKSAVSQMGDISSQRDEIFSQINQRDALIEKYNNIIDTQNKTIAGLRTQVSEASQQIKQCTDKEKPLQTRERETLLSIIIGMAVDGYGYDPTAKKSPVPREISEQLQLLGITVSDDTVRNKLQEAKELVKPSAGAEA